MAKEAPTTEAVEAENPLDAIDNIETISAKTKLKDSDGNATSEGRSISVDVPIPATLEKATQVYGEETVYDLFSRALVIKAQAQIRTSLGNGDSEESIRTAMQNFRPDISRRKTKDPVAAAKNLAANMTEEQRAELLALLQG